VNPMASTVGSSPVRLPSAAPGGNLCSEVCDVGLVFTEFCSAGRLPERYDGGGDVVEMLELTCTS